MAQITLEQYEDTLDSQLLVLRNEFVLRWCILPAEFLVPPPSSILVLNYISRELSSSAASHRS